MTRRWLIAAVVLGLSAPNAWAQRSAASSAAVAAHTAEALGGVQSLVASGVDSPSSRTAQPAESPWWVGPDPVADQTRVFTEFVTQLPIERLQRVLQHPGMFRVVEAGVGAAMVSYAATRSDLSAHALYAGVQAIRFAGGDTLSPAGFHFEPSVSGNGVAIFVRRRLE